MSTPQTNLIAILPHKELHKLDRDVTPTPQDIRLLLKQVYACARSVPSSLGGAAHGHLGMVMTVPGYHAVAPGTAWDMPDLPQQPIYNGQAAAIANQKLEFETEMSEYNTAHSLENQLKNMLQAAVPSIYTASLEHDLHGYATVTCEEILTHLTTNYGTIRAEHISENLTNLNRPWDPNSPIETVFNNTAQCQQFAAAAGEPIADSAVIRAILKAFQDSGLFEVALNDWRNKPAADQTVANLRVHFNTANLRRLEDNPTKRDALKANKVTGKVPEISAGEKLSGKPEYYCWSHGAGYNPKHTSATCTNQAPGHQCEATLLNMMGGNNVIARKRGETAVYKRPARPQRPARTETTQE